MPTMKNPIPVFGVIGGVLGILISLCLGTRALWGGPIGGAIGAVIGAYLKERTRKMGHDVRHAQYGVSLPVPSRRNGESGREHRICKPALVAGRLARRRITISPRPFNLSAPVWTDCCERSRMSRGR